MGTLSGKVALVTGASRGIGRAIALRLARDGALVAVHYGARREAAEATLAAIAAAGGQAFAVGADLGQPGGAAALCDALAPALRERTGSAALDILVHNAGISPRVPIEQTSEELFDQVFAVNVRSVFFLTQRLLPQLRDGGRIIAISSGVTRIAYPETAAYSMTKGALNTMALMLAKQLGGRGITVNAVLPGIIETDMNAEWMRAPEAYAQAAAYSAFGRVGQPEDVADVVGFVASPDGRWVTGQLLDATGGSQL